MLILGIDSAGHSCAACVWRDGIVMALASERMERGQDARLVPLVLDIMRQAQVEFADLDRLAVVRGPGSFTGIRIGLAAARGMGLAANKPVLGIDRFAIHCSRQTERDCNADLLVVIDSKRQELFCRLYPAGGAPEEARMLLAADIVAMTHANLHLKIAGDDMGLPNYLPATTPECVTACALAAEAQGNDPAFAALPLYLRPPDVTMPKPVK